MDGDLAQTTAGRSSGSAGSGGNRDLRGGVRDDGSSLSDLAYDRIEELFVRLILKPGAYLSLTDLQAMVGLGRSPVHEATRHLARDTHILILPRRGLRIAPIDLARERRLLKLRRKMERFVVGLAAERATPVQRNQMKRIVARLDALRGSLDLAEFNRLDRILDGLVVAAGGEPFIEHSLRPLRTMFRRIGFVYLSQLGQPACHRTNNELHAAVAAAVAAGKVEEAIAASDALVDFVDRMFEPMQREIDPALLDATLDVLDPAQ